MKASDKYAKIVEWPEEDGCYVGTAPGLLHGGCHGHDERQVFEELCRIVDDVIGIYEAESRPLPKPTSGLSQRLEAAQVEAAEQTP
jgi:predicted RNase H-like HicB family nuclease